MFIYETWIQTTVSSWIARQAMGKKLITKVLINSNLLKGHFYIAFTEIHGVWAYLQLLCFFTSRTLFNPNQLCSYLKASQICRGIWRVLVSTHTLNLAYLPKSLSQSLYSSIQDSWWKHQWMSQWGLHFSSRSNWGQNWYTLAFGSEKR